MEAPIGTVHESAFRAANFHRGWLEKAQNKIDEKVQNKMDIPIDISDNIERLWDEFRKERAIEILFRVETDRRIKRIEPEIQKIKEEIAALVVLGQSNVYKNAALQTYHKALDKIVNEIKRLELKHLSQNSENKSLIEEITKLTVEKRSTE
jgi:hypothetical protein